MKSVGDAGLEYHFCFNKLFWIWAELLYSWFQLNWPPFAIWEVGSCRLSLPLLLRFLTWDVRLILLNLCWIQPYFTHNEGLWFDVHLPTAVWYFEAKGSVWVAFGWCVFSLESPNHGPVNLCSLSCWVCLEVQEFSSPRIIRYQINVLGDER